MKKIAVVTGAGGFIGGHLVKSLFNQGYHVRAVDIKSRTEWHQFHTRSDVENYPSTDCSEYLMGTNVCHRANDVYNLAADMGGMGFIETHRVECLRSVLINTNLIEAAQRAGVERYFFASSACVYNTELQKNPFSIALKEEDAYPAMAERGYGWEKLFSEMVCQEYAAERGLETYIARFHNVYGPYGTWKGGREKAPAAICRKVIEAKAKGERAIEIWGDGKQTRSFMYIDDCIEGIHRIINCEKLNAIPINLGSSELVSINDLVSTVETFAGIELKRIYNLNAPRGVWGRNSDNTRIKKVLDWEPRTSLNRGIMLTYKWIEEQIKACKSP